MTDKDKLKAMGRWFAERAIVGSILIIAAKALTIAGAAVMRVV